MNKLIFLPGMDGSGHMYESLIQCLADEYECTVISLSQTGDQSYEKQARAISEQIANDKVVLFAESYSGYIALLVSQLKPDHVKHIIFAASFISNPNWLTKFSALLPIVVLLGPVYLWFMFLRRICW